METYLIAMIKFFFKPRRRLWDPEGTISLVQITAPKLTSGPELKGFAGSEASQRLAYLAQVVDTQGWSTRGATSAHDNLSDIFIAEASHAPDVLDDDSDIAHSLDQRIAAADNARLEAARAHMQAPAASPPPSPTQPIQQSSQPDETSDPHFNPYPTNIHQRIIQPSGGQDPATPPAQAQAQKQPSEDTVSPDIMRLANNNDLSISALAHEAQRLKGKDEEVVISLR
jgi:hypothetical protein